MGPLIAKTLAEWNAQGYRVRQGERMSGRNAENVATFTADQVEYTGPGSMVPIDLDDEDDDIPMDFASTQDSPPW